MFISQHLMFRSCLSEIVWFKFQIILSWRVPVWTATSQRGTFLSIILREDALISGKIKSVARTLRWRSLQQSTTVWIKTVYDFCSAYHDNPNSPDWLYQKKVWLKSKYLSKLTFTMFQSVCCLFHAKSCRLSDHEKSSVLLSIFCYVSLNQALCGCGSLNLNISRLKWHRFETSRSQITE